MKLTNALMIVYCDVNKNRMISLQLELDCLYVKKAKGSYIRSKLNGWKRMRKVPFNFVDRKKTSIEQLNFSLMINDTVNVQILC